MKAIVAAIRHTLDTHFLWMREQDIQDLARRAALCVSPEQRIRFVSHEIEAKARKRYKASA